MTPKQIIEAIKAERPEINTLFFVGCGASSAEQSPAQYFMDCNARKIRTSFYTANEFNYATPVSLDETAIVIACSLGGTTPETVDRPISVPEKVADLMELTFQGAELLDIENTTFGVQLAILDGKILKIVELTQIYTWKSTTWKVSEQEVPTVIMDAFKASEYGNDQVESIYMFTDANGAFHKFNVIHNGQAVTVEFDVFGNIVTNK